MTADPASLSAAREALERAQQMAWKVCEVSPGQIRDDGWGVEELKAWLFAGCEAYASALGTSPAPEPDGGVLRGADAEAVRHEILHGTPNTPERVERIQEADRIYSRVRPISGEPPAPTPEPARLVPGRIVAKVERPELQIAAPPAAPTAATPDPKSETNLRVMVDKYVPKWEQPALYAAIWDWHRRTLGGEPDNV